MKERDPSLRLDDAPAGPRDVRIAVVDEDSAHPLVDTTEDDWLTTIPHLLFREVTVVALLVIGYAVVSYLWDAPLLDIANPSLTPNPAKAPWYFLGLQELLHYYPPFISGVIIPGLAVVSLIIIPYFDINVVRAPFLSGAHYIRHVAVVAVLAGGACLAFLFTSEAGPVWPLIGTTCALTLAIASPLMLGRRRGLGRWLASRSLPFWIFTWFVVSWIVLTIIGVYFRGPGWRFVSPWGAGSHG